MDTASGHQHVYEKTLADGGEREGSICFKFQDSGEHESNEIDKGSMLAHRPFVVNRDPYG